MQILHEATCDNHLIVKCFLNSNVVISFKTNLVEAKTASTNLLQLICFRIFCSKHSITFEKRTYCFADFTVKLSQ